MVIVLILFLSMAQRAGAQPSCLDPAILILRERTLGIVSGDFNGDGYPDLAIANHGGGANAFVMA